MPFDVTQIGKTSTAGNTRKASPHDFLEDVTYLSRRMSASPQDILQLPHSHFLSYLKHNMTMDLRESGEEGQKILDRFERYMNPRTEADLGAIRRFAGYNKAQKKEGE